MSWHLLLVLLAADGARTFHPLLQAPSEKLLREFLEREIDWADGEEYSLSGNYRASMSSAKSECRGSWTVKTPYINADVDCKKRDPKSTAQVWEGNDGFSLEATGVGKDVLVYRANGGRRAFECIPHECQFFKEPLLIELIPGAADRKLHDVVADALRKSDSSHDWLLFQGGPAKTPRAVSEVLFANGHEADAKTIAALLEPLIGAAKVKPWPGDWAYDVVVVAGPK